MPLVLASRSPQRRAILEQLGIRFEVVESGVEEVTAGPPEEVALENAFRKARAVAAVRPGRRVLGADTVVALGAVLYDKPQDRAQAEATLRALAGHAHRVVSAICLIEGREAGPARRERTAAVATTVRFRALDEALLRWYLDSEDWRERAGAYGIQGRGAALVAGIEGDYLNVVGLPVAALLELAPDLLVSG